MTAAVPEPPADLVSRPDVGLCRPALDDFGMHPPRFPGLVLSDAWIWSSAATGDGRRIGLLRAITPTATPGAIALLETPDWSPATILHGPAGLVAQDDRDATLYAGPLEYGEHDGTWTATPVEHDPAGLSIAFGPTETRWRDGDFLDLSFRPLGDALYYRLPGPPHAMGYLNQICRVTGRVDGTPYDGFGGFDRYLGEPGVPFGESPLMKYLSRLAIVFAGLGPDGRAEYGMLSAGLGEYRYAMFGRSGDATVVTNQVEVDVRWTSVGGRPVPTEGAFEFAGRRVEFRATADSSMSADPMAPAHVLGEVREAGRPFPDPAFCWIEYRPDRVAPDELHPG